MPQVRVTKAFVYSAWQANSFDHDDLCAMAKWCGAAVYPGGEGEVLFTIPGLWGDVRNGDWVVQEGPGNFQVHQVALFAHRFRLEA